MYYIVPEHGIVSVIILLLSNNVITCKTSHTGTSLNYSLSDSVITLTIPCLVSDTCKSSVYVSA